MILLKNKILYIQFLLFFVSNCFSQNLYDYEHTKKFADYLFKSKQYELSAQEFERLIFLNPSDFDAKLQLIKSYRLSNNYNSGITKLESYFNEKINLTSDFSKEYLKLLVLNNNFIKAGEFLKNNNNLTNQYKNQFTLNLLVLDKDWILAKDYINSSKNIDFNPVLITTINEASIIKYKKPGYAMLMSAIIPGTGKIYSKEWKNGLISLLFVAANSWQAYRGFSKQGIKSTYGWIFGSLSFGFYCGNIYGSYKSAKRFNNNINDKYLNEAKNIIYSDF